MSTHFSGEGNIGSEPEFHEFPNAEDEPHRLLRLNVYFDNPVPKSDGSFEDRRGFWSTVELWHKDARAWSRLYQTGMRVMVDGRMVREQWQDREDNPQVTFKIEARRIGVLPYRIEAIKMAPKAAPADDLPTR